MPKDGFQIFSKDLPPPSENVPFLLELWCDRELRCRVGVHTGWTDSMLETLMVKWMRQEGMSEERMQEFLRYAKAMRDARKPDLGRVDRAMADERLKSRSS